jgi:anaphase-promoting complex subunit 1
MADLLSDAKNSLNGDDTEITGVELDTDDFSAVRFGQDRRLEDVARMLRSSGVISIKVPERPELK